ncbi:Kinesin-like protein KIF25, partial [Ophiophagus hannah]
MVRLQTRKPGSGVSPSFVSEQQIRQLERKLRVKTLELEQSLHEMNERLRKEKQRRKVLHNSLLELKGNIRVHCRIRPFLPFDAAPEESVMEDRVYSTSDSQVTVFADVSPLLTSLLDGLLSEKSPGSHWVEVSVVEVYNNDVFDLLAKDNSGRLNGIKRGIMTNKEGKNDIPLLTNEPVEDVVEFLELVNQGLQLRAKQSTLIHTDSSRSHLVITLTITIKAASGDDF